jgi:ATP-dependent Clp protease ATP-binding subunit ClpC
MNYDINFASARYRKARFGRTIAGKGIRTSLTLIGVFLLLGAGALIATGTSLGWILVILATPFVMLGAWASGELQEVPIIPNAQTIEGAISSDLLGRLENGYDVAALIAAALKTPEGRFLAARFGLVNEFFDGIVEHAHLEVQTIWQEADRLRLQLGVDHISGVAVLAATVRVTPGADAFLAQIQISSDDLVKGVEWYHHLQDIVKEHAVKKKDGGIGRDWSFGYTPMLSRFGVNISDQISYNGLITRDIPAHMQVVDRMITLFSQGGRQNAALIGGLGTGKTTLVHALAERLLLAAPGIPRQLRYQQVFALDPSALISQAHGRGELEGLINQLFYEAFAAKNIILFLDDAHLFFEDGTGSVDLSNILLPVLEGGGLRMVLAMDEQNWLRISQRNAALAQYVNRVPVEATNQHDTMLIAEDQLILVEHRQRVTYMFQALEEAYRLSDRYMHDQSMPGKMLTLLESAAGFSENGFVTAGAVRQAIEQSVGVKVGTADSTEERNTLLNLEDLIHQRMINQTHAVQVVSDALRRARAGVRNQERPIGTFLFLGPTGVGKTELSKALAAVFFGGEDRLVRIDLNEYVQPNDVSRLIASAAQDPNSLTAQISRQPFSVVLLDEIEKAHPNVLNTLLQLLDEGILRDINNREVSFRDAIVIATSNAGADRIRQYIEAGWQLADFEQRFIDELINSNQFRPEFLNRFDEITVFRPLNQEELLQVIDLILAGINKTLAVQKVSLTVSEDAKRLLVQAGYDPRMGARPMRRIVQRAVENIIAKRMLGGQVLPGQQMQITLDDVQSVLSQQQRQSDAALPPIGTPPSATDAPHAVRESPDSVSVSFHDNPPQ